MAGKTLSTRDTLSMESVRKFLNKDLVQECAALSLLLVVAFMILSIVSYDPADIAGAVWPVNAEPHNLGGRIGAVAVHYAYTFLGVGTYLLVAVLGVYATLIFFRRKAADWPVRLIGTVMLVATFSAMFGDSYADSGIMPSRGGVIGTTVFGLLAANFGLTGTYLVLAFTLLLSFLLATDILFYPIIRDLLHPLGKDDEAISGPLTPPEIPDPILPHEPETKEGGNWLTRMLKRSKPEVADGDEDEEDETDEESEIVFEPDLALIPAEPEPVPAPEPQQVGARRPAIEKAAPEPVETLDWEAALASYRLPEVAMLNAGKKRDNSRAKAEMTRCAEIIRATFAHFRMDVRVVDSIPGPTVTTYEMEIPPDVMLSKVERVKDNLALNLRVHGVRFVTQAGKSTVGIEVPNHTREMVSFREILETSEFEAASKKMDLPMAFGKDALGTPVIRDLAAMPHLLVGGATGQGKSVFENVLLASLLMSRSPRDLRMVMVDPKQVEFAPYRDIPHLLAPVIDDSRRAVSVFEWLAEEMERRYTLFKHTGVRKMAEYNELSNRERRKRLEDAGADPESEAHLPSIVAIVDELADLILVASDTKIDELIARIAAKARAAGIHLILVTQSPRADVLNGLIKSNIPARVSLRVNTGSESRIVLDQTGAEDLMGKGDLLMVMPGDPRAIRVQSAFIADDEMNRMLDSLRTQLKPNYVIDPSRFSGGGAEATGGGGGVGELDPDFVVAVDQIMAAGRGSASFLRTAMGLGHTRATRIIIQMERAGILGPARGSKEREILITFEEWEARKASGNPAGSDPYDSMVAA
ncbi:MAG: DNA translocase FtsK [Planctomycetes bacterium]|nr:DNA translocase FtsK [Planctomycetota bacterium]MCW8137053.1 DNA translocase FtsK [Planctomycetota bacterium]